jgi:hypothetical protein
LLAALSPRRLFTARPFIGLLTARFGAAMTARVAFSGPAMRLVH